MTDCFWTDFLGCSDPDCGAPPAHLYAKASVMRITTGDDFGGGYDYVVDGNAPNFNAAVFSDPSLLTPVTPTSATITELKVYSSGFANCEAGCWSACVNNDDSYLSTGCVPPSSCAYGADPESPPTTGLLATYPVSLSFDPTGPFPFATAFASTPIIDGVTHHNSNTVVVASVHTDVGDTLYVFTGTTCY